MPETLQESSATPIVKLVTRAFMRNPYPALSSLRESCPPVAPVVRNGFRMWVVTRYDDVRAVLANRAFERDVRRRLTDHRQSLVAPERAALLPDGVRRGVIDRDGADHARLREVVNDHFRMDSVARLRPRIRDVADAMLDELPAGEPIDLVRGYTRPFAATVISEILGIPPDERDGFPDWESSILTGTTKAEIEDAGRFIYEFCLRMLEAKRAQPAEDLLTRIVEAVAEGRLDNDEAASTVANLLIGGMEPSTAVGSGVAILLTHRAQLDKLLADPGLLPGCVEEILRFESPFRLLGPRFASQALEVDGATIPAGELIALCPAAANRDPRRFADPDAFDMTRRPNPHLSFGHGMHHCIGVHLGRLETSVGLEAFFSRFAASRLAVSWDEIPWRPGAYQRRLHTLPVILAER